MLRCFPTAVTQPAQRSSLKFSCFHAITSDWRCAHLQGSVVQLLGVKTLLRTVRSPLPTICTSTVLIRRFLVKSLATVFCWKWSDELCRHKSQGKPDSLMRNLLDDNSIDATYIEDYLLTYRAFNNEPLKTCSKLLEWFDNSSFRDKVPLCEIWFKKSFFFCTDLPWTQVNALLNHKKSYSYQPSCSLLSVLVLHSKSCGKRARVVSLTRKTATATIVLPVCWVLNGYLLLSCSS